MISKNYIECNYHDEFVDLYKESISQGNPKQCFDMVFN